MSRHDRGDGGGGLIHCDSYKAKHVHFEACSSFEHQPVSLSWGTELLAVIDIYLSSGLFSQYFSSQFSELLIYLQAESENQLIISDFNFHVNIDTDMSAKKIIFILHPFDLFQHVHIPPHTAGNALSLVVSRDNISVKNMCTDLSVRSDHLAVLFA